MKYSLFILLLMVGCNEFKKLPEVMDGEKVPPMPNEEENNKTLEGIDSNNNFVRDDVELWILKNFENPNMRKGLKQYARYRTKALLVSDNPNESMPLTRKYFDTIGCLHALGFALDEIKTAELDVELLNTESRLKAASKVSANFSGEYVEILDRNGYLKKCEFTNE